MDIFECPEKGTMMRKIFSSLGRRLLLLVVCAAAPAFGLLVYTASEQRLAATENAKQESLQLARDAVRTYSALVSETRQYLSQLAQRPEVDITRPASCSALLASELVKNGRVTAIRAAGP